MGATTTDAMFSRLENEVDERKQFIDGIVDGAQSAGRDLDAKEMELITRAKDRIVILNGQLDPLRDTIRISAESSKRVREMASELAATRSPEMAAKVEYRSAGAYIAELYFAQLGDRDSQQRLDLFHRAAAHQTTADNPGLIPETIVTPVVNYVQAVRPLVATLGPTDLGSGAWAYARVTQHTSVAKQAGEKTELASRKMTITKTPLGADTFGGYVNVSKQDINRSSPSILDMIVNDLAEQYAIATELETGTVLTGAATAGPVIPTGPATGAAVAQAIWGAAGTVFAATKGQGSVIVAVSPDMLGMIGPIFPPINPTNAYSSGFQPFTSDPAGVQGSIAGLSVIMSAGLAAGTILVYSTAAAKTFEYRYGNLQVVEPSVWGVQVGYAGDFDAVVIEPAGVVKVTKTP
jgi:HK97 family phage major capsid protein